MRLRDPVPAGWMILGVAGLLCAGLAADRLGRAPVAAPRADDADNIDVHIESIVDVEDDEADCSCNHAADIGATERERIAIARACEDAAAHAAKDDDEDEHCSEPWKLFAALPDAVILTRSTGDCGGCGALAHASIFRGGEAVASGILGTFGRFGNGPDAASWVDVGPRRALALDSSESMGGYSYEFRSLYFVEGEAVSPGTCAATSFSNTAGVEPAEHLEWRAMLRTSSSGALDIRYRVTNRGAHAPKRLRPRHLTENRVRAASDDCVEPDDATP